MIFKIIFLIIGAFSPPVGAQFIFKCDSANDVEEFVAKDPYVQNRLVTEYDIKEWNVVVGSV